MASLDKMEPPKRMCQQHLEFVIRPGLSKKLTCQKNNFPKKLITSRKLAKSTETLTSTPIMGRRAGKGASCGVGLKLGPVRAEWCIDNNQGIGSTYIRFGERF